MRKASTIKIGETLQKLRKSFGYTQEKLAEEIEVSTRYIGDIEQDRAKPSYEVLIKICNLYNISLDQIFSEYLNIKENKMVEYGLYGYQNLEDENKKTIDYLINYFNKKQKNLNKEIVQYCYFLIFLPKILQKILIKLNMKEKYYQNVVTIIHTICDCYNDFIIILHLIKMLN